MFEPEPPKEKSKIVKFVQYTAISFVLLVVFELVALAVMFKMTF